MLVRSIEDMNTTCRFHVYLLVSQRKVTHWLVFYHSQSLMLQMSSDRSCQRGKSWLSEVLQEKCKGMKLSFNLWVCQSFSELRVWRSENIALWTGNFFPLTVTASSGSLEAVFSIVLPKKSVWTNISLTFDFHDANTWIEMVFWWASLDQAFEFKEKICWWIYHPLTVWHRLGILLFFCTCTEPGSRIYSLLFAGFKLSLLWSLLEV